MRIPNLCAADGHKDIVHCLMIDVLVDVPAELKDSAHCEGLPTKNVKSTHLLFSPSLSYELLEQIGRRVLLVDGMQVALQETRNSLGD